MCSPGSVDVELRPTHASTSYVPVASRVGVRPRRRHSVASRVGMRPRRVEGIGGVFNREVGGQDLDCLGRF